MTHTQGVRCKNWQAIGWVSGRFGSGPETCVLRALCAGCLRLFKVPYLCLLQLNVRLASSRRHTAVLDGLLPPMCRPVPVDRGSHATRLVQRV